MVYRPRVYAECWVKGDSNNVVTLPIFQMSCENVIGITADWFSINMQNDNNKYDWLFDNIEKHEIRIYVGMVDSNDINPMDSTVKNSLSCVLHGWFGPIQKSQGTQVKNTISAKGGDASYILNKRHVGDRVNRTRVPDQLMKYDNKAYNSRNPWQILCDITGIDMTTGQAHIDDRDQVSIRCIQSFKDYSIISGMLNPTYDNSMDDTERKDAKEKLYQTNNNSILEIIDDLCLKTGYEATVLPGKKEILIYETHEQLANYIKNGTGGRKALYEGPMRNPNKTDIVLYAGDAESPDQLKKLMYLSMSKYPGYEDGLEFSLQHWDWVQSVKQNYINKKNRNEIIQASAIFKGNSAFDGTDPTVCTYTKVYDPISEKSMRKKIGRTMNRMLCNRITGYGVINGFATDLYPGIEFTLKGSGYFSGQKQEGSKNSNSYLGTETYLITSVKYSYSSQGATTAITFRLKDLEQVNSDRELKTKEYTAIYVK